MHPRALQSIGMLFFMELLLGANACASTDMLRLRYRLKYKENNTFTIDSSGLKLEHSICYDPPRVIDAYFCKTLYIDFANPEGLHHKRRFLVERDTNLIKIEYDFSSVWHWETEHTKISGCLMLKHWNARRVRIRENIFVEDLKKEYRLHYYGCRTFHRERIKAAKENF